MLELFFFLNFFKAYCSFEYEEYIMFILKKLHVLPKIIILKHIESKIL